MALGMIVAIALATQGAAPGATQQGATQQGEAAAVPPAAQSTSQPMTLADMLAATYRNNPTLGADREGLKILDEDVSTARAAARPTLVAEGTLTRSEFDVIGTGGIGGVRVNQPLFRGGRVRNNVRAAETNVLAGRETLRQSEIQVVERVVAAYAGVLRDREAVALNDESIAALGRIAKGEQDRMEIGDGTTTNLAQARARLAGATALRDTVRRRLDQSVAAFRQLTGVEPGALAPLPPLPELPTDRDTAVDQATDLNPEVRQARLARRVADYQRKAAEANLLPTLDFSGSFQRRDEIVQILNREIRQTLGTFQLVLTVPLFQGGGEYAAIRRAKHVVGVRDFEIAEIEREVGLDVAVAWSALRTARDSVENYGRVVAENQTAVNGVKREAQFDQRTVIEVLNAEAELRNASISLIDSRHDAYVAAVRLLAAIGRLTPESFGAQIDRYDPDVHYRAVSHKWIGTGP